MEPTEKMDGQAFKQETKLELTRQETMNRVRLRDGRLIAREHQNVVTLLSRLTKAGKMWERRVAFSGLGWKMKEMLASEEVKGRMARLKERRQRLFCPCCLRTKTRTKMSSVALLKRERDELRRELVALTPSIGLGRTGEDGEEDDGGSDDATAVAWSEGLEK